LDEKVLESAVVDCALFVDELTNQASVCEDDCCGVCELKAVDAAVLSRPFRELKVCICCRYFMKITKERFCGRSCVC
jgi:hypothetical protein